MSAKPNDTQSVIAGCGASGELVKEHDRMIFQMRSELSNLQDHIKVMEDNQRLSNIGFYEALERVNQLAAVLEERISSLQEDKKNLWAMILAGAAMGWEVIKGSMAHIAK